jgi:cell division septation protein DedD
MLAVLGSKDVNMVDPEKLDVKSTVAGGARDFWYFFAWDGFRPRAQGLDQPVTFPGDSAVADSATASSTASSTSPSVPQPTGSDTAQRAANPNTATPNPPSTGFTVSFAALLSEEKAQQLASSIKVNGSDAHVVSTTTAGSPIFRVVMGPFATREEADRIGRASKRQYWIYEGSP